MVEICYNLRCFTLNFGPQHPAAHGVLRLILILQGENILFADPHIGFLHRGTEKLLEYKTYIQGMPYFDRLDYVSMVSEEHAFCIGIENLLCVVNEISFPAKIIRVIFLELTRLLNHLLALSSHAMDVGALSPILWAFEEREKILEFYERVSGARMHACLLRPGGVSYDVPLELFEDISIFCNQFFSRLDEIEFLLSSNRVWKERLYGIGTTNLLDVFYNGLTGVMARASGFIYDIRVTFPYELYDGCFFNIPFGVNGDCFDRFLIRMFEMRESVRIIYYFLNLYVDRFGSYSLAEDFVISPFSRFLYKQDMGSLIYNFIYRSIGIQVPTGWVYSSVEAPKGEMGVFLISDGTFSPYRCKIRTPGYMHLQALDLLVKDHLIADLVAVIGSIDIVFGEIDR
jgi:NADH dehydrogenase (ubiquinone) Fe-S protein 2